MSRRLILIQAPDGDTIATKHGIPRSALSHAQRLAERYHSDGAWLVVEHFGHRLVPSELFRITRKDGIVHTSITNDLD